MSSEIQLFQNKCHWLNDKFFFSETNSLIYTKRSIDREVKILEQKLTTCKNQSQKLIWLAPWLKEIFDKISPALRAQLIWVSPTFYADLDNIKTADGLLRSTGLIYDLSQIQIWVNEISADEKFIIANHAFFDRDLVAKEIKITLIEILQQALKDSARRLKTINHFQTKWQYNFIRNKNILLHTDDFSNIDLTKPDALLLAGPSVEAMLEEIKLKNYRIWCVDTVLAVLLNYGIMPDLVFSIDASPASWYHFISKSVTKQLPALSLVLDPLAYPQLYQVNCKQRFSYLSSNPLLQNEKKLSNRFTLIQNKNNDVYGAMQAVYQYHFAETEVKVIGLDGKNKLKTSHARGVGYYQYFNAISNRLSSIENYMYAMNKSY